MPVRLDRPVSGKARTHRGLLPGPSHNRPHTLRHYARTDDAFPLSVRGAYATAGARPHRAEPGAIARPTKGGAVRIRIALTAAIAVITGLTTGIFTPTTRHAASAHSAKHGPANTTHLSNTALAGFAIPTTVPVVTTKAAATTPVLPPVKAVQPAAPVTPPPPPPPVTDATSVSTADWACIRVHESGDRYNDPSEPSGAYGILISTWRSFGYSGWPYQASPGVQDALALRLYSLDGFRPWSSRYACGI
jgi:hypothetical protein